MAAEIIRAVNEFSISDKIYGIMLDNTNVNTTRIHSMVQQLMYKILKKAWEEMGALAVTPPLIVQVSVSHSWDNKIGGLLKSLGTFCKFLTTPQMLWHPSSDQAVLFPMQDVG